MFFQRRSLLRYLELCRKIALLAIFNTLASIFLWESANAAEWSALPSVRLNREYSDNLQLTTQPHTSVTGSMISPKLDLIADFDIWRLTAGMEAVQKRYSGNDDVDRDDRFYNLGGSYKTERSTWQITGVFSKNSVLANEKISTDTGAVQTQKIYDTHTISPSWTWAMDELTQLQLAYTNTTVSYVNGANVRLNDYSTHSTSFQLTRQLSPQNKIFASAGYSSFNVPLTTFNSKSATYQAGAIRNFSETMQGTISAGTRKTSSEQNVYEYGSGTLLCPLGSFFVFCHVKTTFSRDSSYVYNANLEKKYEATQLALSLSRAFDPSGLGGQVQTDSQSMTLSRQFSSRLTGSFSANNYNYKSETGTLTGVNRHLYTFQPSIRWLWTPELSADLSYQYAHVKRAEEDQPVTSKSVYLTLMYAWPKISFSR